MHVKDLIEVERQLGFSYEILDSLCFNPVVSLPDNNFVRQALAKLE